jgi:hypothetical protein
MSRPLPEVVDAVAPPRAVGLPIIDARGIRRITQADLKNVLRIPRGGEHGAELVATKKYYDGGAVGGPASFYASLFVIFRVGRSLWRTTGVRILMPEAERIARALQTGAASKPCTSEEPRLAGTGNSYTELRAEPVRGAVLLFVRYAKAGGFVRTRGVEVRTTERPVIAAGLREFIKQRGRA